MTAHSHNTLSHNALPHTLPDGPINFAFCPAYDIAGSPQQIRWSGRPLPTASQCAMLAVSATPTEGEGVHGSGYHHRDRSGEA